MRDNMKGCLIWASQHVRGGGVLTKIEALTGVCYLVGDVQVKVESTDEL